MEETLKELVAKAPAHIKDRFQYRSYARGVQILPSQKPIECLFIIDSGIIEILKESYSGSFITVNVFEAGSFLGEIELFCPELRPYTVMTKTACQLILVPKDVLFDWMREDFSLTLLICKVFSRRLYFTSNTMSRIAMLPLKQRILGCIDTQYRMGSLSTFTKQMLVSQTRAPLRSVNRIVRECIAEGIIDYKNKTFIVRNEAGLADYALEYEL